MNRTSTILLALALAGGFLSGIILSQIIGIIGFVTLERAIGPRGLPIILAVIFAGVAAYQTRSSRRG